MCVVVCLLISRGSSQIKSKLTYCRRANCFHVHRGKEEEEKLKLSH